MPAVTVRYWAAAKEAAGVAEEVVEAATLAAMMDAALARRGGDARLAAIFVRSSFLVNGAAAGREAEQVVLPDGAVVEVLPPFAGG